MMYDIVTVGGGVAASSLAKAMADHGARVLVLERETHFRDRVRGEAVMSWGTAEAKLLGVYETIMSAGGHELPFWDGYQDSARTGHRNLLTTTSPKEPVLACFHPALQEALIQAAAKAGAEVRRGVRVVSVECHGTPTVVAEAEGRRSEITARLVVAADGRGSPIRSSLGFHVHQESPRNMIAGLLLTGVSATDDATHAGLNTQVGSFVLLFPQGNAKARAYVCYGAATGDSFAGDRDVPRFLEGLVRGGFPEDYFSSAKPAGPLATFSGAATWVDHPYREGVALLGDAASQADPTWGQGLSLALRDARVLRDHLLKFEDWDEAGNSYAQERDYYYSAVHAAESWQTRLLMETGPEADTRRERAFSLWREDRSRNPDVLLSGPVRALDEGDRRRFFGEE